MPEHIDITARGRACLPILVRAVSDMDHMCGTHDFKSSAACAATRPPAACAATLPPAICCVDASGCVPTSCWLGSLSSDSDSENIDTIKAVVRPSCNPVLQFVPRLLRTSMLSALSLVIAPDLPTNAYRNTYSIVP